jgi:hypothetical protein
MKKFNTILGVAIFCVCVLFSSGCNVVSTLACVSGDIAACASVALDTVTAGTGTGTK